ncbi:MAG: D-glycero-beta-D-manno-heptose 1-phosphate adenylyltransferase [Bacteroidota bacterium]
MWQQIKAKIMDWQAARTQVETWQKSGEKVVFTNGCYDILHVGHAQLLANARALGDRLLVAVNTDASVRRLKGSERPINEVESRQILLASLQSVDAVVSFEEDTPLKLILHLQPDCLVKGGDWALDQIVGAKEVRSSGGEVYSLPFLEGYSTTDVIEKIKNLA